MARDDDTGRTPHDEATRRLDPAQPPGADAGSDPTERLPDAPAWSEPTERLSDAPAWSEPTEVMSDATGAPEHTEPADETLKPAELSDGAAESSGAFEHGALQPEITDDELAEAQEADAGEEPAALVVAEDALPFEAEGYDPVEVAEQRLSHDELESQRKALSEQHADARRVLEALEIDVAGVEQELTVLVATQGDYDLLEQACSAVETLSEKGIGELFWGELAGPDAEAQLREARAKILDFQAAVRRLEDKLLNAQDAVAGQQEVVDFLEYDLFQALQLEESRKAEWVVERKETSFPGRLLIMPWARGFEDDALFRRTLAGSVLAGLLLGLLIPFIDLPIPERNERIEVPERLASFIRKEPEPFTPPPQPVREEEPEVAEEPEPELLEEEPEQVQVAAEPTPAPEESVRDKVNSKGILAFRQNFSNLSESRPAAKLGSAARISEADANAISRPERAMVATQGPGSSGGINLASVSRDLNGGGVELAEGVQVTQMASAIDGGGPDDRPRASGAAAGRTDEEIQIVFDRYKAALYRLYNRELRKDPTLRGQMVLRLTIEPDGTVSLCELQSSDMGAPSLAERVLTSVSSFQFGEKDVPPVTILYPIDFLPTA